MEGIAKMKAEDSQNAPKIHKKTHRNCDEKVNRKINQKCTQNEAKMKSK